jgi:predicted metalloprotease with PDZ domain
VDSHAYQAPLGGLENGGYKLTYTDKPNSWSELVNLQRGSFDFWYSLGLHVDKTGNISDVLKGGISDKGGVGPGMQIVAVNGRAYTPDVLKAAVHDGKGSGPAVELIVENTGYYKIIKLDYHDGERYPQLERVASVPDRLDDILKPEAK